MSEILTLTPNPAIDVSTSVERVVPTDKLRCSDARRYPGGGGINVARVIRRLGSEVTALYPRGGITGQLLSRLLEIEAIASEHADVAGETREDFSVYEESTSAQFRFVLPGPLLSEPEWQACLDRLSSSSVRPRIVVGSGSLPPGVPPDFYARACRIAKSWNSKFVLDTSGPALNAALAEGVHLIKPNLQELSEVVPGPLNDEADWIRACAGLVRSQRAEVVALTLGDRGALLVDRDRVLRAEPLRISPISSVGAGDSFLGAMVWSLAAGDDLANAFRLGVAAGSSALLNAGTELAHADDTRRLATNVVIRAM